MHTQQKTWGGLLWPGKLIWKTSDAHGLYWNNGRDASHIQHTALNKTWTNVSILSERHQKVDIRDTP